MHSISGSALSIVVFGFLVDEPCRLFLDSCRKCGPNSNRVEHLVSKMNRVEVHVLRQLCHGACLDEVLGVNSFTTKCPKDHASEVAEHKAGPASYRGCTNTICGRCARTIDSAGHDSHCKILRDAGKVIEQTLPFCNF